jgi:hypothetical protein
VDPRKLIPGAADGFGPGADDAEPLYVPAHVIRDFLEFTGVVEAPASRPRVDRPKVDAARLEPLLKPLNPWILGWYERADNNSRIYGRVALRHLLAGRDDADELAEKIIYALLEGYASHDAGILRGEARRIGIPVQDCPEEVWDLLERISEFYDDVLREQNIGRIIETTDGFHAIPANPRRTCRSCGEATEAQRDFLFCPACGKPFNETCRNCEKSLRVGWKFCPRCGTPTGEATGTAVAIAQARRAAT